MKKFILYLSISFAVLFTSCDYVSNPYPEKNANITSDTAACPSTFPTVTTHIKKILMEDYTGHTCANCPRAARSIAACDLLYPGQINALAIASGSLAAPTTAYPTDFRTTVGTTYDNFFGASNFGLPEGMINRKNYNDSTFTHLKFYPYQTYVGGIVGETSVMDLQIALNYNSSTRKVSCSVRDSALSAISGTYRLAVVISQDSIIDFQDDIDVSPFPGTVTNYVHRHMLRDAITPTGAWGEPLIGGSASAGLVQVRHFAYTIPAVYNGVTCVPAHCHILAYVYNTTTFEVIQSEDVKVIP